MRSLVGTMLVTMVLAANVSALVDARGTPPPPYTDPSQTITNALGGVGRTQGWTLAVPTGSAVDVMAEASMPAAIRSDVTAATATYNQRFVTFRRVANQTAGDEVGVCVRLGPSTNLPALTCADTNGTGVTGGCYLAAVGDSCTMTIRPIQQCVDYASCHQPVWAMASSGTTETVIISASVVW